jgi:hypothetical protein
MANGREKAGNYASVTTHRITPMQSKISRRALVKGGLIAGTLFPAIGLIANSAVAAGLPPLDPKDPTAAALGFVTDAGKVDAAANATYKPNQKCSTCAQFQGKAGDASGGCNIFAGKSVPAAGWCKVWAAKPGA